MTNPQQRTLQQNKAMHKYFYDLANALSDAGFTIEKTLTKPLDVNWTPSSVKEFLWKPVQDALYQLESTTELSASQVTHVYENLNRHIANITGVHVEFPCRELLDYSEMSERL